MRIVLCCLGLSVCTLSCGVPPDPLSDAGKQASLDAANSFLSDQNCSPAIDIMTALYNSVKSDNTVRMVYASAYGCKAGVNYFSIVNDITTNNANYASNKLWQTLTKNFKSNSTDGKMEGTWLATEALMAALGSGAAVPTSYKINGTTNNPGSVNPSDRTSDSNSYLVFIAMASIGATQNRYGAPNASGNKGQNLPWGLYSQMDTTGCTYAGEIVNMLDGINALSAATSGGVSTNIAQIYTTFYSAVTAACVRGCLGQSDAGAAGFDASCTFSAAQCTVCPLEMRNGAMCLADDKARCSAAGVVRFINGNALGWQ